MRECVCTVDIESCLYGMLALGEIVAGDNIGSKCTDGGLISVNRNRIESRAVLVKSDLNAVAFNFIIDVKLISQLAAVEGKSLSSDRIETERFRKFGNGLLHTINTNAEFAKQITPLGSGSVSKGLNDDQFRSEAEVIEEILVSRGIEKERIIKEDKSTTTVENFRNALNMMASDKSAALLSSDFHLLRARLIARKAGLDCECVSAPSPKKELFKNYAREFFAFIIFFLFSK